jgi:hypothetical protein
MVDSDDVTHLALRGGHIGLMAGSNARTRSWGKLTEWLADRSNG